MQTLQEKYKLMIQQGWIPIFVGDNRNVMPLVEGCIQAGVSVIEITCRRPDALGEIVRVKERWPELIVLAGSTVDNDIMVRHVNNQNISLPSISQLAEAGADGFVSIFPFSSEMISTYRETHLLIPGVSTLGEAFTMVSLGAHIAKMVCTPPEDIGLYTSAATHKVLPFLVTGGITQENIDEYIAKGTALLAGGWDIMLGEDSGESVTLYAEIVSSYIERVAAARKKHGIDYAVTGKFPWVSP